jgi:hypothetical protein
MPKKPLMNVAVCGKTQDTVTPESYDERKHSNHIFCAQGHPLVFCNYETKRKHFRHLPDAEIDHRCAGKSAWHANWQSRFEHTEVWVGGSKAHRADALLEEHKLVVEFQHSNIAKTDVGSRNSHYNALGYRVLWILDLTAHEYAPAKGISSRILANVANALPRAEIVAEFRGGVLAMVEFADLSVPDKLVVRFGRPVSLEQLVTQRPDRARCTSCLEWFPKQNGVSECILHAQDIPSFVTRVVVEEQIAEFLAQYAIFPAYRYHSDVLRSPRVAVFTESQSETHVENISQSHGAKRPCRLKRCACRLKWISQP